MNIDYDFLLKLIQWYLEKYFSSKRKLLRDQSDITTDMAFALHLANPIFISCITYGYFSNPRINRWPQSQE